MNTINQDNSPSTYDLSVIIVNWNTRALLVACLETVQQEVQALRKQDIYVETIVVDNASDDGSADTIRARFPWATLIENAENVGFPGANNQAMRVCQGHYVLLLNSDTEVRSGALKALLDFGKQNPAAGAFGARLLNTDGSLQHSCYPVPTLLRELWRMFHLDALYPFGVYRMAHWDIRQPREVDVLLGACIMLRREVLDAIGLMDESFFMYSEEVDLCYRVQMGGWSLYWVPTAQIMHHGGQSTKQIASEMFLRLYQSKLQFMRKHYGPFAGGLYKAILGSATLVRLLMTPLSYLEFTDKRQQHLRLAMNYRRLLFTLPQM